MTKAEGLSPKEERFCQEVVRGRSLSEAYRLAYRPTNGKASWICVKASALAAKAKLQHRMQELRAPVVQQLQFDRAKWLKRLWDLATVDVRKFFDTDGRLIPITELSEIEAASLAHYDIEHRPDGRPESSPGFRRIRITLVDRLRILALIGKAEGYYKDQPENPNPLENCSTPVLVVMRDRLMLELEAKRSE